MLDEEEQPSQWPVLTAPGGIRLDASVDAQTIDRIVHLSSAHQLGLETDDAGLQAGFDRLVQHFGSDSEALSEFVRGRITRGARLAPFAFNPGRKNARGFLFFPPFPTGKKTMTIEAGHTPAVTAAMLVPGKVYAFTDGDWDAANGAKLIGTRRIRRFVRIEAVSGREFALVEAADGATHLLHLAGLAEAAEVGSFATAE